MNIIWFRGVKNVKCLICEEKLDKTLYSYKIANRDVDLCEVCESELLWSMLKQFIIESKFRTDIPCVNRHMMTKEELLK